MGDVAKYRQKKVKGMRASAIRLRSLYDDFNERGRAIRQTIKADYPMALTSMDDMTRHADGWLLLVKPPSTLSERAIRSMFSIYGLVMRIIRTERQTDFYVYFEDDDQVDEVLKAGTRLNVGGRVIECYRLMEPPF